MKKISILLSIIAMLFMISACGADGQKEDIHNAAQEADSLATNMDSGEMNSMNTEDKEMIEVPENFVLIEVGTFEMGSPDTENWRSEDETQHTVTVSDFYMGIYEVTQAEYTEAMGKNPSNFSGEDLPVENVTWLDAIRYTTPFNTENSISAEEANYYGHYPYEIEGNYFSQGNLETKPGEYRQTTVAVQSFSPNGWGLYNMHGNVGEWVWDYYGAYSAEEQTDPAGAESGTLRVYRGGGWNDFAKNMRSAYRATLAEDKGIFNIGIRLVRNATDIKGSIVSAETRKNVESGTGSDGKVLIAYFSWGGNTRGIAEEIQSQTGADLFEIELVNPYSSNYNTVLDEAQRDQKEQARPELAVHVEDMDEYDTVILGFPNWWASIPMPIASFLEEYDFAGKTIIPFCSHGGGRFGQSLTAIAKLAPDAAMGEALSVHYSGGSSLSDDVADWLQENGITE